MYFGDDGELMQGTWVHDEMVGKGEYVFADQSKLGMKLQDLLLFQLFYAHKSYYLVGTYEHGVLEGTVDEYDASGKLTFHGEYQNGVRHGPGTMYFPVSTSIITIL
jgi:antitoxin component YwqK of YwqJK toxin-antitoxin module